MLLLRPIGVIDPPPNRYERGVWEPIAPPLRLDAPKKCAGVKAGQNEPKKNSRSWQSVVGGTVRRRHNGRSVS